MGEVTVSKEEVTQLLVNEVIEDRGTVRKDLIDVESQVAIFQGEIRQLEAQIALLRLVLVE